MNKLEQWYANTTIMQKIVLWGVAVFLFLISNKHDEFVIFAFLFTGFLLYLHFGKKKFENKNDNEE